MKKTIQDPWIRRSADIVPRLGLTALEESKLQGAPSLLRHYEIVQDVKVSRYPRNPEHLLCRGAAAGLEEETGIATHLRPGMNFIGFVEGETEKQVVVKTRGSAFLKVPGVTDRDRGRDVFANSANIFSLSDQDGCVIGKVRFMEKENWAAVCFKSFDDTRPMDLRISQNR